MAVTTIDAEDIIRGEDRQFQFYFPAGLPTGAASWAYSLVLVQTKNGAAVVTKTFGSGDYDGGTERWNFTVPATGTGAGTDQLTPDRTTWGTVRRTDSGYNKVLYKFTCTVG